MYRNFYWIRDREELSNPFYKTDLEKELRKSRVCRDLTESDVVKMMDNTKINLEPLMLCVIRRQYVNLLVKLINNTRLNPSFNNNMALRNAINTDNLEMIKIILSKVDPSFPGNIMVDSAFRNQKSNALKLLLADTRVDPTNLNYSAIKTVISRKDVNSFEILMKSNNKRFFHPKSFDPVIFQAIIKYFL